VREEINVRWHANTATPLTDHNCTDSPLYSSVEISTLLLPRMKIDDCWRSFLMPGKKFHTVGWWHWNSIIDDHNAIPQHSLLFVLCHPVQLCVDSAVQSETLLPHSYSLGLKGDDHECTCAQSTSLPRPCGRYLEAWGQQAGQKLPGHLAGEQKLEQEGNGDYTFAITWHTIKYPHDYVSTRLIFHRLTVRI